MHSSSSSCQKRQAPPAHGAAATLYYTLQFKVALSFLNASAWRESTCTLIQPPTHPLCCRRRRHHHHHFDYSIYCRTHFPSTPGYFSRTHDQMFVLVIAPTSNVIFRTAYASTRKNYKKICVIIAAGITPKKAIRRYPSYYLSQKGLWSCSIFYSDIGCPFPKIQEARKTRSKSLSASSYFTLRDMK